MFAYHDKLCSGTTELFVHDFDSQFDRLLFTMDSCFLLIRSVLKPRLLILKIKDRLSTAALLQSTYL